MAGLFLVCGLTDSFSLDQVGKLLIQDSSALPVSHPSPGAGWLAQVYLPHDAISRTTQGLTGSGLGTGALFLPPILLTKASHKPNQWRSKESLFSFSSRGIVECMGTGRWEELESWRH